MKLGTALVAAGLPVAAAGSAVPADDWLIGQRQAVHPAGEVSRLVVSNPFGDAEQAGAVSWNLII